MSCDLIWIETRSIHPFTFKPNLGPELAWMEIFVSFQRAKEPAENFESLVHYFEPRPKHKGYNHCNRDISNVIHGHPYLAKCSGKRNRRRSSLLRAVGAQEGEIT